MYKHSENRGAHPGNFEQETRLDNGKHIVETVSCANAERGQQRKIKDSWRISDMNWQLRVGRVKRRERNFREYIRLFSGEKMT